MLGELHQAVRTTIRPFVYDEVLVAVDQVDDLLVRGFHELVVGCLVDRMRLVWEDVGHLEGCVRCPDRILALDGRHLQAERPGRWQIHILHADGLAPNVGEHKSKNCDEYDCCHEAHDTVNKITLIHFSSSCKSAVLSPTR